MDLGARRRADLVWRVNVGRLLRCHQVFPDGSYLSAVYPSDRDRRRERHGTPVRVIDYQIEGLADAEPLYRLVTTILDPERAPAVELAPLYPARWDIETAFDKLTTHLRGPRMVLRCKTPDLVRQECYGLLLAHYAIRWLMHEAALTVDVDPLAQINIQENPMALQIANPVVVAKVERLAKATG